MKRIQQCKVTGSRSYYMEQLSAICTDFKDGLLRWMNRSFPASKLRWCKNSGVSSFISIGDTEARQNIQKLPRASAVCVCLSFLSSLAHQRTCSSQGYCGGGWNVNKEKQTQEKRKKKTPPRTLLALLDHLKSLSRLEGRFMSICVWDLIFINIYETFM